METTNDAARIEKYKTLIDTAIDNAEKSISKISDAIIQMDGMTGTKTRHFYNNLLNTDNVRYLEIGTWKGSSLCSAIYKNKTQCVCIDNWSQFGNVKQDFFNNLNQNKGDNNVLVIEEDCYIVDINKLLPYKFNIYMYDGDHSEVNHNKALRYFYDCLDDIFIFIVDDWNWKHVRDGTLKSIIDLKFKVLHSKEIRLTNDNSHTDPEIGKRSWWNGIYIVLLQKI